MEIAGGGTPTMSGGADPGPAGWADMSVGTLGGATAEDERAAAEAIQSMFRGAKGRAAAQDVAARSQREEVMRITHMTKVQDRGEEALTEYFRDIANGAQGGFEFEGGEGEHEKTEAEQAEQAASKMQARARGWLARKPTLVEAANHRAANTIQTSFRYVSAQRKRANRRRPGSRSTDHDSAAVVIQQRARGRSERKKFVERRDRKRSLEKSGQDTRTVRANEAADEAALLLERMASAGY